MQAQRMMASYSDCITLVELAEACLVVGLGKEGISGGEALLKVGEDC